MSKSVVLKTICLVLFSTIFLTNGSILRHWISTCRKENCQNALDECDICFSEKQCKACIVETYPECSKCAEDIFKTNDHEIINGVSYMVCDNENDLHVKICKMFCRGKYHSKGECIELNQTPVCSCTRQSR